MLGSTIRACWGFACEGRRRRGFNSDRVTLLRRLTRISVIRTRDGAFARHHRTEEGGDLLGRSGNGLASGSTRTCNQTIMSGGTSTRFVDFPAPFVEFDHVRCGSRGLSGAKLVRFVCNRNLDLGHVPCVRGNVRRQVSRGERGQANSLRHRTS